ncbi:MAG: MerR family DNA-binding transcriptional regulator [Actinobacteria bacterium]|nr:MerR family DNA-binding transcriptional regulator [Actinomycetota bacterium]
MVAERAYLSIGEVLSLLKDEFPDITISKIRFLESQGLLDPERTPSGYRKFYESDVERLRWILRQQREHFLPLKVIKGRLTGDEVEEAGGGVVAPPAPPVEVEGEAAPVPRPEPDVAPEPSAPPTAAPVRRARPSATAASPLSAGASGVNLTAQELADASGLPPERVAELEKYGFFTGRPVAGTVYYDEEALIVAGLAAGFLKFGIEARHLRAYKNAAEREAGLFEQVVTPLLKQRNPQARRQAVETLGELSEMGGRLRAAMVRQALKGLVGG